MQEIELYRQFVASESNTERHKALSSLTGLEPSWRKNLLLWEVLGLLPSRSEKSRLAHSLRLPREPSSEWSLVSYLLSDADQDTVGNAINCLNFSRQRSLTHRLLKFFALAERPQRVLYCLARFAEEARESRLAPYLAPYLDSELSDAFLARSFNAMFRLGVRDSAGIRVARELIVSHIEATNMDRKAAVAAVVYLCFAGSSTDLEELERVRSKVNIPELRRLLNWGFDDIRGIRKNDFSAEDAEEFFRRAAAAGDTNFSGYGCFSEEALTRGLKLLLDKSTEHNSRVIETVLDLGHGPSIETLALHPRFSLASALKNKNKESLGLWQKVLPFQSPTFCQLLRDPKNAAAWKSDDAEAFLAGLEATEFLVGGWQGVFEKSVSSSFDEATTLLCAQIFALEKTDPKGEQCTEMGDLVYANTRKLWSDAKGNTEKHGKLTKAVYGCMAGGEFPPKWIEKMYELCPFGSSSSWAFNAFALCAPELDHELLKQGINREVAALMAGLQDSGRNKDDFLAEVVSRFLGILSGAERFGITVSQETLTHLDIFAKTLQGLLDALEASQKTADQEAKQEARQEATRKGTEAGEEDDEETGDWSGNVVVDKPIRRWNAVVQTLLKDKWEDPSELESTLKESIRVAPHTEKRWVVRALVRLGTDDAIKAVLYQALQHVDGDFVAHTIRELLKSKHPRAQQALIRCVGRNSVSDELKLLILEEISLDNPQDVLQELRTLEILRLPQHIDDAIRDAVGRVAALIDIEQQIMKQTVQGDQTRITGADVDMIIKKQLKDADNLSVDVKSALRTAEMILIQSKGWGTDGVDLSPIVNMHCKAVELTLRETFEAYTDAVIRKGVLSRKLDVLGYARPIPEKMQVFEDFLASLPVIKSIPYFSKFKLRKMLRAVCLYRPGKRFTLDGPKAFALLFLVASRKKCQFGLENLLRLDFPSDQELFEFIKLVHSLQDSRNRAVHEGLTWEAQDEIEGMRTQAYRIIENCQRIQSFLQKSFASGNGKFELGA